MCLCFLTSCIRISLLFFASLNRRLSSSVSKMSSGIGVGLSFSSSATKVKYAEPTCVRVYYVYLREMKGRDGMILMVIRPISVLIFLGFVPLPPFPILGGIFSHILFILLTGVILYYIRVLVIFLSKFYKNSSSLYLLVMLPFVIFYMRVFFRII